MSEPFAQYRVTEESHHRFAEFSGDLNPLHVDREASKLLPPGQRLAYGMDLLLWALESLAKRNVLTTKISGVRIRFPNWVFIDDIIELRDISAPSRSSYELQCRGNAVAVFDLQNGPRSDAEFVDCVEDRPRRLVEPRRHLLTELEGQEGMVPVASNSDAALLYPLLSDLFGAEWVSECATCSYIIGMEAPGLYSMSMKYNLQICAQPGESRCMRYKVVAADERFRKIRIAVRGSAMTALLDAMVREP